MNQVAFKVPSEVSILSVAIGQDKVIAQISDGREVSIPLAWFPKLIAANKQQLHNFQISPSGYGVHWPDLDEDISIRAFINL